MKKTFLLHVSLFAVMGILITSIATAATPEVQKAFADGFKKAIESKDSKAVFANFVDVGLMPAQAHDVIKGSLQDNLGKTVESIELGPISPLPAEKQKEAEEKLAKSNIPMPTYLLKLTFKLEGGSHSMQFPVSEKDGKLIIVW